MKWFIALVLTTSFAQAQTLKEFLAMNDEAKMSFIQDKTTEVYDDKKIQEFVKKNSALVKQIEVVGLDVANVWGDTILEGPYSQNGDATVEVSGIHTFKGQVYAIHAIVSAPAYMIESEDCEYDEEAEEWSDTCEATTIYQNFYVDVKGKFIESDDYAEADSE